MFVVVSALLLYFDLGWFFYLKTFQHGAFIFIEFELLSLLLSYDGLFVELDDSNEPNQSDDSNDPRNSSSSCSLGEICRTLLLEHFFSYYEFPYPSTVRDHTQSRDDVQVKKEVPWIVWLRIRSQHDFNCENDDTKCCYSVKDVIVLFINCNDPYVIKKECVNGEKRGEDHREVVVQELPDGDFELERFQPLLLLRFCDALHGGLHSECLLFIHFLLLFLFLPPLPFFRFFHKHFFKDTFLHDFGIFFAIVLGLLCIQLLDVLVGLAQQG